MPTTDPIETRVKKLEHAHQPKDTSRIPKTPQQFCETIQFDPDPWQLDLLNLIASDTPERILANVCRQGGKTQTAAVCSVYHVLTGANRTVVIISPSMRQSQYMFRRIMQVYRAANRPIRAVSETALQLRLENNSWIIGLPSSEDTVRGLTASLLWVEEASRCSDTLINAALPFVATVPNAKICMMSTPAGQRGMWYTEWAKGVGYKKILVNADQCPRISRSFLDSQLEMMGPRYYAQEYYNSFESNEASIFRHEVIQKCIRDDLETLDDVLDAALDVDSETEEADGVDIDDLNFGNG